MASVKVLSPMAASAAAFNDVWMAGDLLPAEIELDEMLTGMQLDLLTDVLVRDRVAVLVEFDVVVDVDLAATDIDILVGVLRWRFKRGFIQRVVAAGALTPLRRLSGSTICDTPPKYLKVHLCCPASLAVPGTRSLRHRCSRRRRGRRRRPVPLTSPFCGLMMDCVGPQ